MQVSEHKQMTQWMSHALRYVRKLPPFHNSNQVVVFFLPKPNHVVYVAKPRKFDTVYLILIHHVVCQPSLL